MFSFQESFEFQRHDYEVFELEVALSVKFITINLTPNCSRDLMFAWRQDFDSLVFQTVFLTFCEKSVLSLLLHFFNHFNLDFLLVLIIFELLAMKSRNPKWRTQDGGWEESIT